MNPPSQLGDPIDHAPSGGGLSDLLAIAGRRRFLLLLGLVVGTVLGGLNYTRQDPVYQSNAQILVIRKTPEAAAISGADARLSGLEDYLATHSILIRSPLIVNKAVVKYRLGELASFKGIADPTRSVAGSLAVLRDAKETAPSNILTLTCRNGSPYDTQEVLQGVVNSYKDFLDETYHNVNDDTVKLIASARDILEKELAGKEADYRAFRQDNPVMLWKSKGGNYLYQDRLTSIDTRRTLLLGRKAEAEERLRTLEAALADGRSRPVVRSLLHLSEKDNSRLDPLYPLFLEEQTLLENYGADHPKVISVRNKIAFSRRYLLNGDPSFAGTNEPGKEPAAFEPIDPVKLFRETQQAEIADCELSLRALDKLFHSEQEGSKALNLREVEIEHREADILRTRLLYENVVKRLQEINVVRDFGGYDARVIAPAELGVKVAPNLNQYVGLGVALGLVLGGGLAYLAEVMDRRFRNPEEVRRRLGLPIVGYVPILAAPTKDGKDQKTAAESPLSPILQTHHKPRSQSAEAFRGMRTNLYFGNPDLAHQIIQVTSASPGDGKSTVAANLAIAIAQSGKTVLLIDADLRKPTQHRLFGLAETAQGFATALTGEARVEQVVVPSGVERLSIIPAGPKAANPAELLTSQRLPDILHSLREQYDYVLLDTPPLQAVSDPGVIAPRADGVLLVLRLARIDQPRAERAKELLTSLGAKILGIVINDPERAGQAHTYGGYGYGYYYDNGYGYGAGGGYYHDSDQA